MNPIRILIADDHPLFRDGMHGLLDSVADTEVVGEATTGDEAVSRAKSLRPDVILMDIKMPGINGIEATRTILASHPNIHILMITMLEDDESVFAAMRAGARGYVLKGANQAEILRAIRAVVNGEAIFGPGIAKRVLGFFAVAKPTVPRRVIADLSEREMELLALMAQGRSNQEIAEQLGLTLKTVRNHVSNIFSKLQVADRAQAVIRAREAGLGYDRPDVRREDRDV
jgi:DNA-binding NarL/FixJ family response regulator